MNNKISSTVRVALLSIGLTACSDYQAHQLDDSAVIPANTILNVSLTNSPQLIPNQFPEVTLSVKRLVEMEVSGVDIVGTISVNTVTSRANFTAESIIFEANNIDQPLPFNGVILDSDNITGMQVRCIKGQVSRCGLYEFVNRQKEWSIETLETINLSGVTLMAKSS